MGDARTAALPLVGADESDWAILFSQWGVLHLDRTIAAWTRAIGWIGMVGTVAWLAFLGRVE
jgi:Trk-type K+ transport system membrane component